MIHTAWYRWGMLLAIIFLMFVLGITSERQSSDKPRLESYASIAVPLMLLFNHLAMAFSWRRSVSIAMNVLAGSWVILGSAWIVWSFNQENTRNKERPQAKSAMTIIEATCHYLTA